VIATDWANLTVAGAFVLGATLGTFAAIRVMRAVLHTFDRRSIPDVSARSRRWLADHGDDHGDDPGHDPGDQ